jgi:hypothetical protein
MGTKPPPKLPKITGRAASYQPLQVSGVLGDQGIRNMVKPEAGGFNFTYHGVFIPHGLYVLPEDEGRARELLSESAGDEEDV